MQRFFNGVTAVLLAQMVVTAAAAQERPQVVTVNYPLQYFTERLVGDAADVVFPVPADVDPSFWRPSIADVSEVQTADLILLNGAKFATWVDRVSLPRSRVINSSAAIEDQFIVTESITHSHGDGGEHSHEGLASYVWLDPVLAAAQAEAIAAAITARDIAPAGQVEDQLEQLRADLTALDQTAEDVFATLASVPMIATHPRYQYLAGRYALTVSSLDWEAGEAPNPDQLAELSALRNQTGAEILIWEAEPPAAAIEAAEKLGLQNVVFPTLAHKPTDRTFIEAYQKALSDFSTASQNLQN
ncbi:metal ABC transporter substrate-binding protein [Ruegeria sp. R14_0]|uniref:metal ABC transporter substrate-binding protein n=1 Tax=Ruegeria sp. R14_0 TaxID=2821100 RepID=UPI001ADC9FE7|nr:metal ABC transporter substrate-binding protein [Ruegeria sp. R14_0]MBO9446354.1 zinc ABC transporter substrate-binding protein [Ruegeria sp. R14_0]